MWLPLLGSLRKGSFNGMVARTLPKVAGRNDAGIAASIVDDIPLYDADIQQEGDSSHSVGALAEQILTPTASSLVVTPEYNLFRSAASKNAIDWLSRSSEQPLAVSPFLSRPVQWGDWRRALPVSFAPDSGAFLDAMVMNKTGVYGRRVIRISRSADWRSGDQGTLDHLIIS